MNFFNELRDLGKGMFEAVTRQSVVQERNLTGVGIRIWVNDGSVCP